MKARIYPVVFLAMPAFAALPVRADDDKPEPLPQRQTEARADVDQQMKGLISVGEHDLSDVVTFSLHGTKLYPSTSMPATGPYFGAVTIHQLPGAARVRVQYINGQPPQGMDNGRRFFQMDYYDLTVPGTVEVHDQILSGPDPVNIAEDVEFNDGEHRTVQLVQAAAEGPEALRLYVQDYPASDQEKVTETRFTASSFTDLCWQHPREADEYLRPFFRRFQQEAALFAVDPKAAWEAVGDDWKPDAPTITATENAVARLGAESFDQRERATADLRKLGQPAAVYLMRNPRQGINLEQEMRIDLFLVPYRPLTNDQAMRLGKDKSFLIDCLYNNDPMLRRLVLNRLKKLTGQSIDFDEAVTGPATSLAVTALRDKLSAAPASRPFP